MSVPGIDQGSSNNDALQAFSETCSMIYGKISKRQFEYLQAITDIQEDMLGSCNGLIKSQVDQIEEYSKTGVLNKEQTIPLIAIANKFIESYLNYLSLEYDLALARMRYHHKIFTMMNDSSPKLTQIYMEWIKLFKIYNQT